MNPPPHPVQTSSTDFLLLLALLLPLAASLLMLLLRRRVHWFAWIACATACLQLLTFWFCLQALQEGLAPDCLLLSLLPGLDLALKPDRLSFALAIPISVFWPLLAVCTQSLQQGENGLFQTRNQISLALTVGATTGMACAGNLPTLYLFYCLLIFSSCPFLLTERRLDAAADPVRRHLLALLIPALLLMPVMAHISTLAGTLEFADSQGLLTGQGPGWLICLLFLFCLFGFAANGVMPCHRWLFACLDAPLPASVLAQAVLGPAGLFASARIMLSVFGNSMERLHLDLLVFVLWGSMAVLAALLALYKDSLTERLTWSTVSQFACVVLGLALDSHEAAEGALLLLTGHCAAKLCALLVSGPLLARRGSARIQALAGLGRELPFLACLLTLALLSLSSVPPLAGFAALWLMLKGALAAHQPAVAVILVSVAVLHLAAFAPVVQTLFFAQSPQATPASGLPIKSAPLHAGLLWPSGLSAVLLLLPGLVSDSALHAILESVRPWNP